MRETKHQHASGRLKAHTFRKSRADAERFALGLTIPDGKVPIVEFCPKRRPDDTGGDVWYVDVVSEAAARQMHIDPDGARQQLEAIRRERRADARNAFVVGFASVATLLWMGVFLA